MFPSVHNSRFDVRSVFWRKKKKKENRSFTQLHVFIINWNLGGFPICLWTFNLFFGFSSQITSPMSAINCPAQEFALRRKKRCRALERWTWPRNEPVPEHEALSNLAFGAGRSAGWAEPANTQIWIFFLYGICFLMEILFSFFRFPSFFSRRQPVLHCTPLWDRAGNTAPQHTVITGTEPSRTVC